MENIDFQKMSYRGICSQQEVNRIFDMKDGSDYLLKLRADTILDHMRLYRVYLHKIRKNESNWSLEKSFSTEHYSSVLNKLNDEHKKKCLSVSYGDIFSNDPNGLIFNTEHGVVTTISESLNYFLLFSQLAILNFESKVPLNVRHNSLRIAIRTMLKTESMDFDIDPRGIIPNNILRTLSPLISRQKQFIAGHEFSHYILGHLDNKNLIDQPVFFAITPNDEEYKPQKVFNNSQKNEFEADIQAILLPNYSEHERAEILDSALLWFGCLELYQAARDVMCPVGFGQYQSHPSARDRFENLITNIPSPKIYESYRLNKFHDTIDGFKKFLQEDISRNFEGYEFYGSVYLSKPNTKWRGKQLIDRVDY